MRSQLLTLLSLAFLTGGAAAQAPRETLPFLTLDGQLGSAFHPARSGATYYRTGSFGVARLAAAVRLGSRASFRPVLVAEYFTQFGMGDQITNCPLAPNGTCRAYFPEVSGRTVGLGVRKTVGTVITVGLTGGVGRYTMGAEKLTGFHADAELALRFMKHAAFTVNVRRVEAEKFKGAHMWFQPVTVGLRIQ